jgi:hypothetical protein
VLVQNGTYTGSWEHHKKTDVDSEAVTHVISQYEDIAEALSKINAAYALVWYNVAKKSLYIVRNDQRPMWVAEHQKYPGIYFASEPGNLMYTAERNRVDLKAPRLLAPYELLTISMNKEHFDVTKTMLKGAEFKGNFLGGGGMGFNRAPANSLTCAYHNPARDMAPTEPIQKRSSVPNAIELRFSDSIMQVASVMVSAQGAYRTLENFNEFRGNGEGTVMVELVDSLPANGSVHCSSWWVYGHVLDESDVSDVVIWWLVHQKSADEVLTYICDNVFTVQARECTITNLTYHGENKAIIMSRGVALQAVNIKDMKDTTKVLTHEVVH